MRLLITFLIWIFVVFSCGLFQHPLEIDGWASDSFIDFPFKGIYAVAPLHQPFPNYVLDNKDVVGISLREDWGHLEPTEGSFDWKFLDQEIKRIVRAGKVFTFRIYPGIHTPEWVYKKGSQRIRYKSINPGFGREKTKGQFLTFPVPWDRVFLGEWKKFVTALGKRYGMDDKLAVIHVMGPNAHAAEMYLPNKPENLISWKDIEYTQEKLINAWKFSIDLFAETFPKAYLCLNLSHPVIFEEDRVVEEVTEYAFKKYGRRFLLQNNALRDPQKAGLRRKDFDILREYSSKTVIGFQLYDIASPHLHRGKVGDLRRSLDYGLSLGASYFEIFPPDIRDQPHIIKYAANRLIK